jgi:hypothetical protein
MSQSDTASAPPSPVLPPSSEPSPVSASSEAPPSPHDTDSGQAQLLFVQVQLDAITVVVPSHAGASVDKS